MRAKMTSMNQRTSPGGITAAAGPAEYFDLETRNARSVLTALRIKRADAARANPNPA